MSLSCIPLFNNVQQSLYLLHVAEICQFQIAGYTKKPHQFQPSPLLKLTNIRKPNIKRSTTLHSKKHTAYILYVFDILLNAHQSFLISTSCTTSTIQIISGQT